MLLIDWLIYFDCCLMEGSLSLTLSLSSRMSDQDCRLPCFSIICWGLALWRLLRNLEHHHLVLDWCSIPIGVGVWPCTWHCQFQSSAFLCPFREWVRAFFHCWGCQVVVWSGIKDYFEPKKSNLIEELGMQIASSLDRFSSSSRSAQ